MALHEVRYSSPEYAKARRHVYVHRDVIKRHLQEDSEVASDPSVILHQSEIFPGFLQLIAVQGHSRSFTFLYMEVSQKERTLT